MKEEFLTPEQIEKLRKKEFLKYFLSKWDQALGKSTNPMSDKDIALKLVEKNPVYDLETALKEVPNILQQTYPTEYISFFEDLLASLIRFSLTSTSPIFYSWQEIYSIESGEKKYRLIPWHSNLDFIYKKYWDNLLK